MFSADQPQGRWHDVNVRAAGHFQIGSTLPAATAATLPTH
jgi:hypothetical protein